MFTSVAIGDGGITPRDSRQIGQANWYEVLPADAPDALVVAVRLGWDDCEAGCIHERVYTHTTSDDVVTDVLATGDALPDISLQGPGLSSLVTTVTSRDDALVSGATVVATPIKGEPIVGKTGSDGEATLALPGAVYLVAAVGPNDEFADPVGGLIIATGPGGLERLSLEIE